MYGCQPAKWVMIVDLDAPSQSLLHLVWYYSMIMKRHLAVVALWLSLLPVQAVGFSKSKSRLHHQRQQPLRQVRPLSFPDTNRLRQEPRPLKQGEPNTRQGGLMDCTTESCRINCSPKVAARARPKWCANFKEPI